VSFFSPPRTVKRSGFLLLEAILGIALFVLIVSVVVVSLLSGQEAAVMFGDRHQATVLSEQALDAVRSIRDGSFSALTQPSVLNTPRGVAIDPTTSRWAFSGSQVVASGGYVTSVVVTSLAADRVQVAATTAWRHGRSSSGSIVLTSELTDWRTPRPVGDWSSATLEGSFVPGGAPDFTHVVLDGNYAILTGGVGAGAGLYVVDISTPSSPVRVANTFALAYRAKDAVLKGPMLYLLTDDPSAELQVYDLSSPGTLSAGNLVRSLNLPGWTLGQSLGLLNDTLLVGAQPDQGTLYTFAVSRSGALVHLGTLTEQATYYAIAATGTSAYLATSIGTSELRIAALGDPANPQLVPALGADLPGAQDALSIVVTGTAALIGQRQGAEPDVTLLDLGSPGFASMWHHTGSGDIVGVATDAGVCYGFLAANTGTKALQILRLWDHSLAEIAFYNSQYGPGRQLVYDVMHDRLFLVTRDALLIFKPASTPGPCE